MTTSRPHAFRFAILLALAWLVAQLGQPPLAAQQKGGLSALEPRVAALEATLAALKEENISQAAAIATLEARVTQVEGKTAPISVTETTYTITGRNVFIVDGSGQTRNDSGLGNLTVGYNEPRPNFPTVRTGTHNLIVGEGHNYSGGGGVVFGFWNVISDDCSTVTGGIENNATAFCASISGGDTNRATVRYTSVSGGYHNHATEDHASVSGGLFNVASGVGSSVSGGLQRVAPDASNWAAGGLLEPQ